jgi:hypothetical protein
MAEANRSDHPPNPGTPEEALRSDERRPRSNAVKEVVEREYGEATDPDGDR